MFWHDDHPAVYPRLTRDASCDVAIVGAGLTGAVVTHALVEAGLKVVVLDKRQPATGSTAASTALILYDVDTPLRDLMRTHGRKGAVASYRSCLSAIHKLRELIASLGIDCEFKRRPSLYLASCDQDIAELKEECATRADNGFAVEYLDSKQLRARYGLNGLGAIRSADAAEVNPVKLTRALLKAARADVYSGTVVTRIRQSGNHVTISTRHGYCIRARWVVLAAGYETRLKRRLLKLRSSYVMITKPLKIKPPIPEHCLIWETSRPYIYIRTTPDNRIMIGGGDEPFIDARTRNRLIPRKSAQLHARLKELFPKLETEPEFRYAGVFGESGDGLPYIGPDLSRNRLLHALCYGANGTNFAIIAADVLRDHILGKPNRDATLFSLHR